MGQSSSNLGPRVSVSPLTDQIIFRCLSCEVSEVLDELQYESADNGVKKGGFGEVRKYHDNQNDTDVAMKTILFPVHRNGLPSVVLREISILKELEHENVVRLLDVLCTYSYFRLSFEWIDNDLAKLTKGDPISAPLIKHLLFQILRGVCYCHSQKVLHRDLKPQNLLLDRQTYSLKLADFGLARSFDGAPAEYSNEVGTLAYKAPEIILGMKQTTTAADIWSVGCIFAEMVNGTPPFGTKTDVPFVMRNIISILGVPTEIECPGVTSALRQFCAPHQIPTTLPKLADVFPSLTSEGVDLISKMLCFVPGKRVSARGALQHPYFKNFV